MYIVHIAYYIVQCIWGNACYIILNNLYGLLTFTESIARLLHEKIGTDVIYFDFAKAFDTVSHDLILQKLKAQYKIDGTLLKFFVNYLQGRKQQVIIDKAVSNSVDV